jgi:hypothetical protein
MGRENMSDLSVLKARAERIAELAAMLKEEHSGNSKNLKKILARFSIQEGSTLAKAKGYLRVLRDAGIIVQNRGQKSWIYDPKAEWDLFRIEILMGVNEW